MGRATWRRYPGASLPRTGCLNRYPSGSADSPLTTSAAVSAAPAVSGASAAGVSPRITAAAAAVGGRNAARDARSALR